MNYQTFLWILFVVLLITLSIVRSKRSRKLNATLFALLIVISLGPIFLPRQLWGKWNSISNLDNKIITEIILRPSTPDWEVNLVDKDTSIHDNKQIDSLIYLLQNTEVYLPAHPARIWETKMIIISSAKDSLEVQINRTNNNGTIVYTKTNGWRKDAIGSYLEKITNYRKPVYGDTVTTKL